MGPEILVRDLPPKLEVLLNFAPTAAQMHLLGSLMDIIGSHNRNTLRDTEVSRGVVPLCWWRWWCLHVASCCPSAGLQNRKS